MGQFTIYHNPRCSKSRQALALLESHDIQPVVVEYLKTHLSVSEIKKLSVHFTLQEFVRSNEKVFKELNLSFDNEDAVLQAMADSPILMQRPIVTYAENAVIGRPVENVLALIEKISSAV